MKTKLSRHDPALVRLEVIAILAVLALLGAVVLPGLAGGKPRSDAAVCANNLRQLGMAVLQYSMEENGMFPPRTSPRWPQQLLRFYGTIDVLRCPSDGTNPATFGTVGADGAPRSYLMNGWDDYFEALGLGFAVPNSAMPESAVVYPAETILFGEKTTGSGHWWMDYEIGDDYHELEQSRHGARRGGPTIGGSNYTMVDGSVRMLRFGESLGPTNMWLVLDAWRIPLGQ